MYEHTILMSDEVFKLSHNNPELFFDLEFETKKIQFASRIKEKKLFINFDPHVFLNKFRINTVFDFFSQQNNFVIELNENSKQNLNSHKLVEIFKKLQYRFAIDDFCKENSIFELVMSAHSHYLKIDIEALHKLQATAAFGHILDGIIKFAHELDKKVILKGVETEEHFALAREHGFDYMQGYLFRDMFITRGELDKD